MSNTVHIETLPSGLTISLVLVEGGTFWMGEGSEREVRLSSFYLGKYPVTQDIWEDVMGNNPSYFKESRRPVERVSWLDAAVFCNMLNERCGYEPSYFSDPTHKSLFGKTTNGYELPNEGRVYRKVNAIGYRLPTEAEWEYAVRGGKDPQDRPQYEYAGGDKLDEVGWYRDNSYAETHQVGLKQANELGLYDMSGNVWEWCEDWYGFLPSGKFVDPRGPKKGNDRVIRGGGWLFTAELCCSIFQGNTRPESRTFNTGFRLVFSYPPV